MCVVLVFLAFVLGLVLGFILGVFAYTSVVRGAYPLPGKMDIAKAGETLSDMIREPAYREFYFDWLERVERRG